MDEDKARQLAAHQAQRQQAGHKRGRGAAGGRDHGKKKKGLDGEAIPVDAEGHGDDEPAVFSQPSLITGAKLKSYQLEGLQWMVSLDQNGISGILGRSTFLPSDCAFLKKSFQRTRWVSGRPSKRSHLVHTSESTTTPSHSSSSAHLVSSTTGLTNTLNLLLM
jgi:hypothetical protein